MLEITIKNTKTGRVERTLRASGAIILSNPVVEDERPENAAACVIGSFLSPAEFIDMRDKLCKMKNFLGKLIDQQLKAVPADVSETIRGLINAVFDIQDEREKNGEVFNSADSAILDGSRVPKEIDLLELLKKSGEGDLH